MKITILSGNSLSALVALKFYKKYLKKYDLSIYYENNFSLRKITEQLKISFAKYGFLKTCDIILLKIYSKIRYVKFIKKIKENYCLNEINPIKIKDFNSIDFINFITSSKPDLIITNACSLLKKPFLNSIKCKVVNLHNGKIPRYRGINGNFWAIYEKNFSDVGISCHLVNSKIDDGKLIDFQILKINEIENLIDIDVKSFELGSKMISNYIKKKKKFIKKKNVLNKTYTHPGITNFFQFQRNLLDYNNIGQKSKKFWKSFFLSKKYVNKYEQMQWHNYKTINKRDNILRALINDYINKNSNSKLKVLDIGCGDGRHSKFFRDDDFYIGIDYEIYEEKKNKITDLYKICNFFSKNGKFNFYKISENKFIIKSDLEKIGYKKDKFDIILMIGLLQHLHNPQAVINKIIKCLKPGGIIIINTLRQFSKLELIIICFLTLKFKLCYNIFTRNYDNCLTIKNIPFARRYSEEEITSSIEKKKYKTTFLYEGFLNTKIFSREFFSETKRCN